MEYYNEKCIEASKSKETHLTTEEMKADDETKPSLETATISSNVTHKAYSNFVEPPSRSTFTFWHNSTVGTGKTIEVNNTTPDINVGVIPIIASPHEIIAPHYGIIRL